jgi:oxygen-independent coproporphyrinogen-3 oxidase
MMRDRVESSEPPGGWATAHDRARDQAALGLYVHVPFCARRCAYCDFSTGTLAAAAVERYLNGMALEAARRASAARGLVFTSVFFGGGTPSALSARHFRRLWAVLAERFAIAADAEITLEANPESVKAPLLDAWREAGVNRLSMGAQSFHPDELLRLGRIHSAARPGEAAALARAAGFRRLSLDLMFGFPGNDGERLAVTLERALAIDPEHLSVYCFIPEPGTPLGDAALTGRAALPTGDAQAEAYALVERRLAAAGLGCYETSNFCRPGAEARHNLVYWLRRPYLALGPSAHGFLDGVRYGNAYALADWAERLEAGVSPAVEEERESPASIAEELLMLGLRLAEGLGERDHAPETWRMVSARYGAAFERALATGRLERAGDRLRIPAAHRFLADDVIAWIAAAAERARFDTPDRPFIPSLACRTLHSQVA